MPLIKSGSKSAVSTNIKAELDAGKKRDQAVAIALSTARKYQKKADGGAVADYLPQFLRDWWAAGGQDMRQRAEKSQGLLADTATFLNEPIASPDKVLPPSRPRPPHLAPSLAQDVGLSRAPGRPAYADGGAPRSPMPEWLLGQQARVQSPEHDPGTTELPGPLDFMGSMAELTGLPTVLRASDAFRRGDKAGAAMEAAPLLAPPVIRGALSKIPRSLKTAGAAGLIAGLMGRDSGADPTPEGKRIAEIKALQEQIAGLQAKVVAAQKDIGAAKFRGVGEEAGMARQAALEQAAKPFNDAIVAAQARIGELRAANDEEQNAVVRAERRADEARRVEQARGKPFSETPVGEQWEKLGPLMPAAIGAGSTFVGRALHGPKAGWKLPVAEGTAAGALATNVPVASDAFFSPVANPERKAFEGYGRDLKLAQHPRAQEWLDYAETLPVTNPVREAAQKEFYDPLKAAERMGFGGAEGLIGSGMGMAGAVGLERLGRGVKSLFGSRPSKTIEDLTPVPSRAAAGLPGSGGTAAAELSLPAAAPQSRMLSSPSQGATESVKAAGPLPAPGGLSSSVDALSSPIPEIVILKPGKSGRTLHERGKFSSERSVRERYSKKDTAPESTKGKELEERKYGGPVDLPGQLAQRYAGGGQVNDGGTGLLHSDVPGRTDHLPLSVNAGAYIIPADTVSAMGEGNTMAGAEEINRMLGTGRPQDPKSFAQGGEVPILAAGGEYHVAPEDVARLGGGNMDQGHRVLDSLVKQVRTGAIKRLKSLPGPSKG